MMMMMMMIVAKVRRRKRRSPSTYHIGLSTLHGYCAYWSYWVVVLWWCGMVWRLEMRNRWIGWPPLAFLWYGLFNDF